MNSLYRVLKSEFSSQFNLIRLLGVLVAIVLPLLPILAEESFDIAIKNDFNLESIKANQTQLEYNKAVNLFKLSYSTRMLTAALTQGVVFTLIIRVISILRDKSTLDKNRVSFLMHNKHIVVFSKFIIDFLLFLFNLSLIMILTPILTKYYLGGEINNTMIMDILKYTFAISFLYIITSFGMRYINVRFKNKYIKLILLFVWLSFTIGYYLISSSMLVNKYWNSFVITNIKWIIYVPFLNLVASILLINKNTPIDLIDFLPLIFQTVLLIQIFWNKFATYNKEFLCG